MAAAVIVVIGALIAMIGAIMPWESYNLFGLGGQEMDTFMLATSELQNGLGDTLITAKPILALLPAGAFVAFLTGFLVYKYPAVGLLALVIGGAMLIPCLTFPSMVASDQHLLLVARDQVESGVGVTVVGCLTIMAGGIWGLLRFLFFPSPDASAWEA
jgi:hypothetical protein